MKILVSAGPIEITRDAEGCIDIVQSVDHHDDSIVTLSPGDARLVIAALRKLLREIDGEEQS
jgi:hypothetical protein